MNEEFFEKNPILLTLNLQYNKEKQQKLEEEKRKIYEEIHAKPLITGHDLLRYPSEPNDYLIEKI
jgi:hypothetical protein